MNERLAPDEQNESWKAPTTSEGKLPGGEATASALWQPKIVYGPNKPMQEIGITDPSGSFHHFTNNERFALIRQADGSQQPFIITDNSEITFAQWLRGTGDNQNEIDIKNNEAETAVAQSVSARVFEGVYEQLKNSSNLRTPQELARRFIEDLAENSQRRVESVEPRTIETMFQELQNSVTQYAEWSRNNPNYEYTRQQGAALYQRFTQNVERLIASGDIDELTAKVFMRSLPGLKYIGNYNAVVRNLEPITTEELKQKNIDYVKVAEQIWAEYPETVKNEQEGYFYHFNAGVQGRTTGRLYINAQLGAAPDRVLQAWHEALKETNTQDKIYFKFPNGLAKRYETVIVYYGDKTVPADLDRLLTAFKQHCPDNLLAEKDMPTGVPLSRGISIAPEVSNVNRFLTHINPENPNASSPRQEWTISYNQLIASLAELSFEMAYRQAQKSKKPITGPKSLKDDAMPYFNQLLKLSGVNPQTMMLTALGGQLPEWAVKFSQS